MPSIFPLWLARYGLAVLAIVTTVAIKLLVGPIVSTEAPFLLFFVAVTVSAWYGGLGPGLLATALAALAAITFFLPPLGEVAAAQGLRVAVFLLEGTVASALTAQVLRAKQRATEQREWLRAVLSSMGDAVVAAGPDERVTFLNSVAQALTGWSTSEARGRPVTEVLKIVDEQTRQPLRSRDIALGWNGESIEWSDPSLLLGRASGETPIDTRVAPIRDSRGKVHGTIVVFRDVTERRQAEYSLRESEMRFRNLANQAPVMIWMSGIDKLCFYFNQPWLDFTGRTLEQELGHRWLEGVHADDRQRCLDTYLAAFDAGRDFEIEYRLRRFDGQHRHVLDRGTARRTPNGQLLGYIGSCLDITDRKRVEESLRESEARFRQLADAMPQIVWTAKPDGRPDYYNQRWFDYTGLSKEETFALTGWWQLVHADDRERCAREWAEAARQGKSFQIECRFPDRTTGGYRWFLGRAIPVRNEAGQVVRCYGTCTDIDAQKRFEEALMKADRRKDEFLAMLSHELRNPLAPILNSLQVMRQVSLTDPVLVDARAVIDRQIRQLARIVDDLLDIFGLTHFKTALHKEALDLAALVRQTVEDHRSALESGQLIVELDCPGEPIWIQADRTRLAQVLSNLLQNAAKYTNPGDRVRVRVTADDEWQRAVVCVQDTGVGLTPEVLARVFDAFSQADQSLDRGRGGLGLGLTLVKGLVELHGGKASASSPGPGQGAEFTFWLPLGSKPWIAPATPTNARVPVTRPLRILIVEDNPDTARSLQFLLSQFGHKVVLAETGPAGVEAATSGQPDVVLCDLGLPGMDGYEVAGALRGNPLTASARLIAVSGYGQEEDRQNSRKAGFDLHLTKPVDPLDLQRLLSVLDVRPLAESCKT